ncbi:ABC transporter permease [Caulobacter sp. CCNWLY153]|uniref:ABC transporter permease n=1 Tax=unclassified Caulobacter TaxID=2648921 RepID=UPI002FF36D11
MSDGFARVARGADNQAHVIGALILRELHTRYGRDNIGYLWMIAEPALLAMAVTALHMGSAGPHAGAVPPAPFTIVGYCAFMIFRSVVTRAESALEANKPLLFHRCVTIFDLLASRAILEALSTVATMTILLAGAWSFGLAQPPARPLLLMAAVGAMTWFSFAISMLVCAATYENRLVAKLVHPATYILMPISGAFFVLDWIPRPYRDWLAWSPMNQIFEMAHTGQFAGIDSPYFHGDQIVGWCLALTFVGLLALRVLRRHVHLN